MIETTVRQISEVHNESLNFYLEFIVDSRHFALPLQGVERVVHAVEITVPPKTPGLLTGLINYKGDIIAVVDISSPFHLTPIPVEPHHHFIITQNHQEKFAIIGHEVPGVMYVPGKNVVNPDQVANGIEFLSGVIILETGMILIPDLEKLLSLSREEIDQLTATRPNPGQPIGIKKSWKKKT